jgi:threonylcarbamoyladenosine tRNA methylthiotransferase MtaB
MANHTLIDMLPRATLAEAAPEVSANSVEALSFGCRLNAYEGDIAANAARAAGQENLLIINTCAVTSEAVRQAKQAIRRAHRDNPARPIAVTGCAVQIDPAAFSGMKGVALVVGNAEKLSRESWRSGTNSPVFSDIMQHKRPVMGPGSALQARTRVHLGIQNGCDHRCTFCIIPYGRGPARSMPPEQVVAEVSKLADQGAPEVVLTGVDLTSWGSDLDGRPMLGSVVQAILNAVPQLAQLRLSSVDAIEMDEALVEAFATQTRLAPYLHLSLQHGDDMMLKRMKRRHSRDEALALIESIRSVRPDMAFGADLIVGFPTETDAMADHNASLITQAGLAFVHVFPFSPREGTPAARMPQLDRAVIKARAKALRAIAERALHNHLDQRLGYHRLALTEDGGRARLPDFTPVRLDQPVTAGQWVALTSATHDGASLQGRVIV